VLGMSLLWLFSTPPLIGLRDSLAPLAIAYLLVTPALAWPILFLAHSRVPNCLIEAAALEGCGPGRILRSVVAPLSATAWLSAFAIALLVCIAETGAAMMLCPPGFTPLSVRILTMMHYGPGPYLAALCLMLFSLCLLLIAGLSVLLFGWSVGRSRAGEDA